VRILGSGLPLSKALAVVVALFIAAPMFVVIPMSFSTAPSLEFPPPGYWLGYYKRWQPLQRSHSYDINFAARRFSMLC
jgi:ABC-type spermidine/putrescine transport system permease subunit II